MRVGGICVLHYRDSKTVSPTTAAAAQLRVYFKFRVTSDSLTIRLSPRLTVWN